MWKLGCWVTKSEAAPEAEISMFTLDRQIREGDTDAARQHLCQQGVEEGCLSPNPPKDTDGRREGSGRGWVRELQGRWPGLLG